MVFVSSPFPIGLVLKKINKEINEPLVSDLFLPYIGGLSKESCARDLVRKFAWCS